jgi:hypothetical protein
MNYRAFTNDSLTMMYEAVRGALAADDALKRQESETKFRVRETPDWRHHAADLEAEMLKRGLCCARCGTAARRGLYPFATHTNTVKVVDALNS